jgi:hypothetical protein
MTGKGVHRCGVVGCQQTQRRGGTGHAPGNRGVNDHGEHSGLNFESSQGLDALSAHFVSRSQQADTRPQCCAMPHTEYRCSEIMRRSALSVMVSLDCHSLELDDAYRPYLHCYFFPGLLGCQH